MRSTIRTGSTGPDVATWQSLINMAPRPTTWVNSSGTSRAWPASWAWPMKPDGDFGERTAAATEAWQAARQLDADGVVGPKTWAAAEVAVPPPPPTMRASTRTTFIPFTAPLEGVVLHPYLDIKGLVTVAIGILVDPMETMLGLPFVRPDGTPATRDEIRAAWLHIKGLTRLAQQGHRMAERETTIRLTPAGVEQVVYAKLDEMWKELAKRFPRIGGWPASAQLATISMSWACGPWFRFGTLERALRAGDGDFATAAASCRIDETNNAGIKPRNIKNKALYLHAATATDFDEIPQV